MRPAAGRGQAPCAPSTAPYPSCCRTARHNVATPRANGRGVHVIVCHNCGHSNPDNLQFCENCKSFLEFTGERETDAPPPPPPPPPTTPVTGRTATTGGTGSSQPIAGGAGS